MHPIRKARKRYQCCLCSGSIIPGDEYVDQGGGNRECFRCCEDCKPAPSRNICRPAAD